MGHFSDFFRGVLIVAGILLGLGVFLWRWLNRSAEPVALLIRIIASIPIVIGLVAAGKSFAAAYQSGSASAIFVVFFAALGGVAMAIIWVPPITGLCAGFFTSFIDGGSQKVEPKPFYSIFRAQRNKGNYLKALAEVRNQLGKFPNDLEGYMLMADLQARNLNDLQGAEVTINRVCAQPGHPQSDLSYALNQLADWHLEINKDREGAQRSLEKIMELMPGTEMAHRAAQRIGHLAKQDMMLESHDRQKIDVKKGVKDLGLKRGSDGRLKAPEINQEEVAAGLIAQLENHPLDTDAREKLAVLYARHYHRLDMALEQLELLVQMPGVASRRIARWLNMMVDLQVSEGCSEDSIRATLQRIVDGFPDQAYSDNAKRRLDTVRLELHANAKAKPLPIGSYEQDIGLKRRK